MIDRAIRAGYVGLLAGVAFAVAALTSGPPSVAAKAATPKDSRLAIEAGLATAGSYTLPAGTTAVDQPPRIGSRCTLQGDPKSGSTLTIAAAPPTINAVAPGIGYASPADISGVMQPGDWVYRYTFDWYLDPTAPKPLLCQVAKVAPDGSYATSPASHPRHNAVLRFRRAVPCGQPKEGDSAVSLSNVPTAWVVAGLPVYVTDGPSVADAAKGEHRRIVSVSGNTVRLDRPLRQSYGLAVLAWIEPIEGATVRDLTIDAPSHGAGVVWAAQFKGHTGLRIENVVFRGQVDLTTCGDAVVNNVTAPALNVNTTTGLVVERCRIGAFYLEEACLDVDAVGCEFGPGRHEAQNCVTGWFACERLRFTRCRVVGAGRAQWPPPSAFHLHGRGMEVVDCEVASSQGGSSYLGGDGLTVRGLRSDGGVFVVGAAGASVAHARTPYLDLGDGSGVAVDCAKVRVGTGWQQVACEAWAARGVQAQRAPAPKAERSSMYHREGKR